MMTIPTRATVERQGILPYSAKREYAKHEAAHAVVATRLGMRVSYVVIGCNQHPASLSRELLLGHGMASSGFCYAEGRVSLEQHSIYAAAGIVAEMKAGKPFRNRESHCDLLSILDGALECGVATSTDDPAMLRFVNTVCTHADLLLHHDGGVAWERVTTELFVKRRLSGEKVRAIVAEVDKEAGSTS